MTHKWDNETKMKIFVHYNESNPFHPTVVSGFKTLVILQSLNKKNVTKCNKIARKFKILGFKQ